MTTTRFGSRVLGEQLHRRTPSRADVQSADLLALANQKERQQRRIPHYRVGKLVRFKPNNWKRGSSRSPSDGCCISLISTTRLTDPCSS